MCAGYPSNGIPGSEFNKGGCPIHFAPFAKWVGNHNTRPGIARLFPVPYRLPYAAPCFTNCRAASTTAAQPMAVSTAP